MSGAVLGLLFALLQGQPPLPASGVRSGVALSPDVVLVGAPVVMTVRVQVAPTTRVIFPPTVDSSAVIEPLDPVLVRDTVVDGRREYTAVYRLIAWQTGRHVIPIAPLRIEFGTRTQTLALGDPVLNVQSVLPSDTALRVPRPARDIIALPAARWAWWWLLLGFAVLVLAGGWWLQRRAGQGPPPDIAPIRTAVAAFDALDALGLPASGEPGRHAAAAAGILRQYLAAREPRAALGHTTAELSRVLREQTAVPEYRVTALLDAIDALQFAQQPVDTTRARALAAEARAIVDEVARVDEQAAKTA
jgi:hypothetical protein